MKKWTIEELQEKVAKDISDGTVPNNCPPLMATYSTAIRELNKLQDETNDLAVARYKLALLCSSQANTITKQENIIATHNRKFRNATASMTDMHKWMREKDRRLKEADEAIADLEKELEEQKETAEHLASRIEYWQKRAYNAEATPASITAHLFEPTDDEYIRGINAGLAWARNQESTPWDGIIR